MIVGNCIRFGAGADEETAFIERTLTSIENSTVTNIGDHAFTEFSSLNRVSFPSATSVSQYAFAYCTSLTDVSIPNVTNIYEYAFAYNNQLQVITLPAITYIGSRAFYQCTKLSTLYLPAQTVCQLYDSYVFAETPLYHSGSNGRIYVPAELLNDYISNAPWSWYSSHIFAYPFGGQS